MTERSKRIAADYNRTLVAPVRWVHVAWATTFGRAIVLLIASVLATLVFLPLDGPISTFFRDHRLGGDVRRELEALQQYGQFSVSILVAVAILLLDPAKSRRLLDWAAAMLVGKLVLQGLKMFVGRPRPKFDDPTVFLGPFGAYPINDTVGVRHAWEMWHDISSDLWSMPSSHTAFAVIISVVLARLYPKLAPLTIFLACLVAFARVAFNAHFLTDVIVGAAAGWLVADWAMRTGPISGRIGVKPRQ